MDEMKPNHLIQKLSSKQGIIMAKHDAHKKHEPNVEQTHPVEDREPVVEQTQPAQATVHPTAHPVQATAQPVQVVSADDRYRLLTLDDQYGDRKGIQVKRVDFIRDLWTNKKMSRSDITKELNRVAGTTDAAGKELPGKKKIPYQIVFAATKGVPGGPVLAESVAGVAPQQQQSADASTT